MLVGGSYGGGFMPVNMLKKDIPKGEKPPDWVAAVKKNSQLSLEDRQREEDLAIQEKEALWESEDIGLVRWSGEHGQRYSD